MSSLHLIQAVAAIVVTIGAVPLVRSARKRDALEVAKHREIATAQFTAYCVKSDDEKFQFDGQSAVVVSESESIQRDDAGIVASYSLTRFARNSAGEYFMFISNPVAKPFFKHVEHRIARVVLKDRYVPPPQVV